MVKILAFFGVSMEEELPEKMGEKGRCEVIRLWCRTKFVTKEGLTMNYPAIIDTGAYVSLIPKEIWLKSETNLLLNSHFVRGLVPKEECKMEVKVGEISCHLVDEERITDEYRFMAYFADTNYIPIILGFRELLSGFRIYFDYQTKEAWLEEKE